MNPLGQMSARLRAPAKINLWLKIVGTRGDGYHFLNSLLTTIDLFDEIDLSLYHSSSSSGSGSTDNFTATQDKITYVNSDGKALNFKTDTVSSAIRQMRESGIHLPLIESRITKGIPHGAGLGGGSSDAATVLKQLGLWVNPSVPMRELSTLALKVGADVPFFLNGASALMEGVGEILSNCLPTKLFLVVANPPFSIDTASAYRWFDEEKTLTHRSKNVNSQGVSGSLKFGIQDIVDNMDNDLEKPVEARHPEITRLKKAMRESGALGSQMSGSGSSVFGIYETALKSEGAIQKLRQIFPTSYTFFSCQSLA